MVEAERPVPRHSLYDSRPGRTALRHDTGGIDGTFFPALHFETGPVAALVSESHRTGADAVVAKKVMSATAKEVLRAAAGLRDAVEPLRFSEPVTHVYNPLNYA